MEDGRLKIGNEEKEKDGRKRNLLPGQRTANRILFKSPSSYHFISYYIILYSILTVLHTEYRIQNRE